MGVNISDVLDIVSRQNQWRGREAINLIASENVQSDAVKQAEIKILWDDTQKDIPTQIKKTGDIMKAPLYRPN
ncbi:MAG: hypothetical protein CM1200mP30_09800 [Pseudomonadota bacterium]|nr:MAG: hypothetical protein CM1200mP30_09800 [Pseudomonadota bacterium]